MESSDRTLVIILAVALAIFLVLSILALVKIIQILGHIKRITEKAANLADKAEAVGEFLERAATPLALSRIMANVADGFLWRRRRNRKGRRKDDE